MNEPLDFDHPIALIGGQSSPPRLIGEDTIPPDDDDGTFILFAEGRDAVASLARLGFHTVCADGDVSALSAASLSALSGRRVSIFPKYGG